MNDFKEKNGLIMNFRNDNIAFITYKIKIVDSKKMSLIVSK